MHMADALVSPVVGGTMWAVSAGAIAYSSRRLSSSSTRQDSVPLMGIFGAFVFAAQMINFSIPGTGSSGHIGGGLLLTVVLGPHAALIVVASVLSIQALFFADGGLLALGANIFNLGFIPAFLAYPLVYRPIAGDARNRTRLMSGSIAAAVFALVGGAFFVTLQTWFSGITALPIRGFLVLMLPIHGAIGLVEGILTAAVLLAVAKARPELMNTQVTPSPGRRGFVSSLLIATVVVAGIVSLFASSHPDGLEWSLQKLTGSTEIEGPSSAAHESLASLQEKTSVLPDYGFGISGSDSALTSLLQTPIAGLIGSALVLIMAVGTGLLLRRRDRAALHE